MPLITVLAGSQGWECGISLNNQDCRIKTRRQEQRGHTAAICAAAVVGGSGRGGDALEERCHSAGSGGPPPPERPPAPAGGSGPGASPPAPPQALPEPCRGRRLQRGRLKEMASEKPAAARWGSAELLRRVWDGGLAPRPFVAPSGEPGVGRGQRPDRAAALCG